MPENAPPNPKPKKSRGGRPSLYKPAFADQAKRICEVFGAIDTQLADIFGVSIPTLNAWKIKYPKFLKALKTGKEPVDLRVSDSLLHRAVGYTFDAVKIMAVAGEVRKVEYREHVPPDTTACIFWLKNRRPDLWRDRHEVDHSGKVTHESRPAAELLAEIVNEMKQIGVTSEMLELPRPMIDVSEGVANKPNGVNGKTKH